MQKTKAARPVTDRDEIGEADVGPVPHDMANGQPGYRLRREMVIREDVTLPFSGSGGLTMGEALDRELAALVAEGGQLRSVSYDFDEAGWAVLREMYKGKQDEYREVDRYRR